MTKGTWYGDKWRIKRTDGKRTRGGAYFVLDLNNDKYALGALAKYHELMEDGDKKDAIGELIVHCEKFNAIIEPKE